MDLRSLIETHLDLPRLARDLDELGPIGRRWAVTHWSAADLATLWEATQGRRPVTRAALAPEGGARGDWVPWDGTSSWAPLRHFQKCVCVGTDGADLVGYVRQPWAGLTGPGFFVVRELEGGELAIDYTKRTVPLQSAPAGWPHPAANTQGLRALAFGNVVDVVRGLSQHVVVGRMQRRGIYRDLWFAMVRGDTRRAERSTAHAASGPAAP